MSDLSPAINSRLDSVSSAMDVMTRAARDSAADAREAAARAFSSTSLFSLACSTRAPTRFPTAWFSPSRSWPAAFRETTRRCAA